MAFSDGFAAVLAAAALGALLVVGAALAVASVPASIEAATAPTTSVRGALMICPLLCRERRRRPVRVNVVAPAPVRTASG
ncbi:hypothetical protein GCM10009633_32390 [Janibacter melonis]